MQTLFPPAAGSGIHFHRDAPPARLGHTCDRRNSWMLICRHGLAVATLLDELEASQIATIVIEEDEMEGRRQGPFVVASW